VVRHGVPRAHINLIESCVGWFDERPKNAGELLEQMRGLRDEPAGPTVSEPAPPPRQPSETDRPAAAVTQPAQPADEMRQALLVLLVRELKELHDKRAEQEEQPWAFLAVAAGVGLVLFFIMSCMTKGATWLSFFAAVFGAAVMGTVGYLLRLNWQRETREKLLEQVRTLSFEFPEIVRGWGGENALRSRSLVRQIARRLGIAPAPAAVTQEAPAPLDTGNRQELTDLLEQGLEKCQAANQSQPKPFPFPLAVLLAVVLGGLVGFWLAGTFWGYAGPLEGQGRWVTSSGPGWTRQDYQQSYFDALGHSLDPARYRLVSRWMTTIGVAIGIVSGLLTALVVLLLLTWRKWHHGALLGGLALGVLFGAPAGVGLGFLEDGLFAPYTMMEGNQTRYFSAFGNSLDGDTYQRVHRQSLTTSLLVGIGGGAVVALVVCWLFLRWYRRRLSRARQDYEPLRQRLAGEFGALVAAHGGPAALDRPATLERMLAQVKLERA
jgi:hypothetical protein